MQSEFRLFKWFGAFALAVVVGGFGVLYEQITDVRVEMRNLHTEVLRELHAQMNAQIGGLRKEMHAEHAARRAENGELSRAIGSVRERVARIEAHLGVDEAVSKAR